MHKIIVAVCAALLLAGCAGQPPTVPAATAVPAAAAPVASTDPIAALSAFTVADMQSADTIAVASNDAIAHACFPALIRFVQSLPTSLPTTTVSGAISAFETARTTRIKIQGQIGAGIPDYLKLGCAALVQDETVFVAKLATLAGGGAALGPMAPGLLPVINSALPIPLP